MKHPLLVATTLLCLLAVPAGAARFEADASFTLPAEETEVNDIYFCGSALRIDGSVEGSVLAGCQTATIAGPVAHNIYLGCQTADLSAPVGGDILAGCMNLTISDSVAGTVRVGASSVSISGRVARDLLAGCGTLTIERDGVVVGDVVTGTGTLNIAGTVHGDVRVAGGNVVVSGTVDGDLVAEVDEQIVLTEDARIFGSLRYTAKKELDLGNPDAVFGDVEFTQRTHDEIEEIKSFRPRPGRLFAGFILPFALLSVLGALAVGFLLIAIWKHALLRALEGCTARFGRTVGFGAILLLATPTAATVALFTIVGIPSALITGVVYLLFLYLSKILAGMFLGRWLFRLFGGRSASIWLFAPVGIILVYAFCAIPVIGWLVWLFTALIGFGILAELVAHSRRT
jgi:cytoskeletal protein CcmA (bactofilin family)